MLISVSDIGHSFTNIRKSGYLPRSVNDFSKSVIKSSYLPISVIDFHISVNEFPISVDDLLIPVIHLPISFNDLAISANHGVNVHLSRIYRYRKSFTDIGTWMTDIGRWFTDIGKSSYLQISSVNEKWFTDICKFIYQYRKIIERNR